MRAALARELGYTRTRDRSVPCRVKASIAYRTVKSNAIRDYYSAVNRGGGGALCWCVVNERGDSTDPLLLTRKTTDPFTKIQLTLSQQW